MRPACTLLAAVLLAAPVSAQSWKSLEFLLGKWTGVAAAQDTPRGAGQGDFSFELQLNDKIMVRRNFAEYSSGPRHDDLMVIYFDGPNDAPRAMYFDSEGHVIHYTVKTTAPGSVVFESDPAAPGPRYRLTYTMEKGALAGKFDVAPPGSEYRPYMSWKSRRR